jgi:membrane protein YqaA with SNARE-associated domain
MNDLLITIATVGLGGCIGYYIGRELGIKRGRDEQWIANYLANERKTQAGRDNLGRFQKRKAKYGKIKIPAPKNES